MISWIEKTTMDQERNRLQVDTARSKRGTSMERRPHLGPTPWNRRNMMVMTKKEVLIRAIEG